MHFEFKLCVKCIKLPLYCKINYVLFFYKLYQRMAVHYHNYIYYQSRYHVIFTSCKLFYIVNLSNFFYYTFISISVLLSFPTLDKFGFSK